jgi:hypothetical protein
MFSPECHSQTPIQIEQYTFACRNPYVCGEVQECEDCVLCGSLQSLYVVVSCSVRHIFKAGKQTAEEILLLVTVPSVPIEIPSSVRPYA